MTYDLNLIDEGFLREEGGSLALRSDVLRNFESASDRELLSILFPSAKKEAVDNLLDNMYKPGFNPDITHLSNEGKNIVKAVMEMGRRLNLKKGKVIRSPEDVFREVRHYASDERECIVVVALNGAHEIITTFVATIGLLNKTIVHPREVYAEAIRSRAAAIAIAHNHPSGNIEPSADDKDVTVRLGNAGQILGIKLLDHLVVTDERYYSFLEHGLL